MPTQPPQFFASPRALKPTDVSFTCAFPQTSCLLRYLLIFLPAMKQMFRDEVQRQCFGTAQQSQTSLDLGSGVSCAQKCLLLRVSGTGSIARASESVITPVTVVMVVRTATLTSACLPPLTCPRARALRRHAIRPGCTTHIRGPVLSRLTVLGARADMCGRQCGKRTPFRVLLACVATSRGEGGGVVPSVGNSG